MGSGPRAGLSELFLPELQKGSSIMPGKVNPVIPEVVTQVAAQVIGNDAAITIGGMNGHFELNVYVPLIARNLLESIRLLSSASRLLAEKCVDGIEANREQNERYAELTLSAATALNPYIGYDRASEIVKEAAASGRSLREVAREQGVEDAVLDEALDYRRDGEAARGSAPRLPKAPKGDLLCMTNNDQNISADELESLSGEPLPDREAMSILTVDPTGGDRHRTACRWNRGSEPTGGRDHAGRAPAVELETREGSGGQALRLLRFEHPARRKDWRSANRVERLA